MPPFGPDPQRAPHALLPGTRFVGDLHLIVDEDADWGASEVGGPRQERERFLSFLEDCRGNGTPALVILGDLFEYWFGPAQADSAGGRAVLDALAAATSAGLEIHLVPGNRDFLLGRSFSKRTGVRLHPRGFVGQIAGERWVIVHGDELCTLDRGYLRLRRVLRSPPVRGLAPRLPSAAGRAVARRLRRASTRALATKPKAEAEQQWSAVEELCARHGTIGLVCGHAHRFRDDRQTPAGQPLQWWVVDAFGHGRDLLTCGPDGGLEASETTGGETSAGARG
ncbi:MAG: UDP-2,3-diacylglucosamine diphosphatase [Planctomycetota bacterium]|jgi:UDP-2,3-diacylglucosamine hydrolase